MSTCVACDKDVSIYIMGSPHPRSFGGPLLCEECKMGRGKIQETKEALEEAIRLNPHK